VVLGAVAGLLALALAWLQWLQQPDRPQGRRRQLNRLLQLLEQQGLQLQPGETLESLAMRAREADYGQAELLTELVASYNQLLFAPLTGPQRRQAEARWHRLRKELGTRQLKAL
jgi:hypothetical protein